MTPFTLIQDNLRARIALEGISNEEDPLSLFSKGDGWLNSKKISLFTADNEDYNNPYLYSPELSELERSIPIDPQTGKEYKGRIPEELRHYISKYGTENGEIPLEKLTNSEQFDAAGNKIVKAKDDIIAAVDKEGIGIVGTIASGMWDGLKSFGSDCANRGIKCLAPDFVNEGTAGDKELVDRLQGDRTAQVSHSADELIGGVEAIVTVATVGGGAVFVQGGKQTTKEILEFSSYGDLTLKEVRQIQRMVDEDIKQEVWVVGSASRKARQNIGRYDLPLSDKSFKGTDLYRSDIDYYVGYDTDDIIWGLADKGKILPDIDMTHGPVFGSSNKLKLDHRDSKGNPASAIIFRPEKKNPIWLR